MYSANIERSRFCLPSHSILSSGSMTIGLSGVYLSAGVGSSLGSGAGICPATHLTTESNSKLSNLYFTVTGIFGGTPLPSSSGGDDV